MLATSGGVIPGLASRTVCELLGISYRQLDYAIRCVDELGSLPSMSNGSGSRRRFDIDTLRRLDVAARLAEADPANGTTQGRMWSAAVTAVMAARRPPMTGFAVLTPGPRSRVLYRSNLNVADFPVGPIGGIVRYDLTATPLGKWLAAHDVPPPEPPW